MTTQNAKHLTFAPSFCTFSFAFCIDNPPSVIAGLTKSAEAIPEDCHAEFTPSTSLRTCLRRSEILRLRLRMTKGKGPAMTGEWRFSFLSSRYKKMSHPPKFNRILIFKCYDLIGFCIDNLFCCCEADEVSRSNLMEGLMKVPRFARNDKKSGGAWLVNQATTRIWRPEVKKEIVL